nr:unnamed protein product [Callosobruchus analis]
MVSTTDSTITHKYSSLTKLKRVAAYCIRFIHNTRNPEERWTGNLKAHELWNAMKILIKLAQHEAFP